MKTSHPDFPFAELISIYKEKSRLSAIVAAQKRLCVLFMILPAPDCSLPA